MSSTSELKAKTAFDEINKRAKSQPNLIKRIGAIVLFDITKDGKFQQSWSEFIAYYTSKFFSMNIHLAIDGKQGTIYEGKPNEGTTAQVTITIDDTDFIQLALGKANPPAVYIKNFHFSNYLLLFIL